MACTSCNSNSCSGSCNQSALRYKGPDIDCLGIKSCTAYDALLEKLANEICDLNTIADGLNGVDHVSFTSSTGTPSNVANQPCETDTYTLWADVSETESLGTFTVLNPCEVANYANVAWVDLTFGNDATGQAGRFDLPFLTITAALAASSVVYLRQGSYTETFQLVNGMVVYAEPGVIFTAGGLEHTPNTNISGSFLGYARFESNSIPVQLINNGTVRFECDYVDNLNYVFYVAGSGNLVASTNYIRCEGIGSTGFINSFRDTCTIELYIKEFCEGFYSPYFLRGQNTDAFQGDVKITCPVSRTLEGGVYGAIRKSVLNVDENSGGSIELIGNIECANTTPDTGDAGGVRFVVSGALATSVNVTGDILSGVEFGLYKGAIGNYLDFKLVGNIKSDTNPMTIQSPSVPVLDIRLRFFNSIIEGPAPCLIGQGVSAYFYNCSFYDGTLDDNIIDLNDTGANNVQLYFYNCVAEGYGTGLFIADNMTGYTETLGLTFSNSNLNIDGTLIDTWGGYAQIATLVVPKL